MVLPSVREMKTGSDGLGHMTKMATMPVYGKKFSKSSPKSKGQHGNAYILDFSESSHV